MALKGSVQQSPSEVSRARELRTKGCMSIAEFFRLTLLSEAFCSCIPSSASKRNTILENSLSIFRLSIPSSEGA